MAQVNYLVTGLLLIALSSCNKPKEDPFIKLSNEERISVLSEGGQTDIEVNSNVAWQATSNAAWCEITRRTSGFTISVKANDKTAERGATIIVSGSGKSSFILVSQAALKRNTYKIPVIGHVIYSNSSDRTQNIDVGRFADIIERVNKLLNDWKLEFELVLATTAPDGTTLEEPGVTRSQFNGIYPILGFSFYHDVANQKYAWDPNTYINVYIYHMDYYLGFANYPHFNSSNQLEGMPHGPYKFLRLEDIDYVPGISLNSCYIDNNPVGVTSDDLVSTMAHELGHLYGLKHTFCETKDQNGQCVETDYCPDTKCYNIRQYNAYLAELLRRAEQLPDDLELVSRTECSTGEVFHSHNIMDYGPAYRDHLTPDQVKRMNHALRYGLLVPGPKEITISETEARTRSSQRLPGIVIE